MNKNNKPRHILVMPIKPSHYDGGGCVIQWYRFALPALTLAAMYGLTRKIIERRMFGGDVEVLVDTFDETNTRISVKQIISHINGFVSFANVQSNQFPRTKDMAGAFRAAGIQVCIGGWSVQRRVISL